jgi:hypothetical protein
MTEIITRKFSLTEVSIIQVGIAQIRITKIGKSKKLREGLLFKSAAYLFFVFGISQ